jgi:hypothetical protein
MICRMQLLFEPVPLFYQSPTFEERDIHIRAPLAFFPEGFVRLHFGEVPGVYVGCLDVAVFPDNDQLEPFHNPKAPVAFWWLHVQAPSFLTTISVL